MTSIPNSSTSYRLDRRLALQLFGWRMVLAGVGAMATFLAFGIGGFGRTLGWVFLALTVVLVVAAIWTMAVPPLVVVLTSQGFRLGRPASGEVKRAHWTTVQTVDTDQGPAGTRLVITLESGKIGDIPLTLLPRRAGELQLEVHRRLNTAHGYRRLN
ncbi:MAG: hypothetical protein H7288_24770 [Kineosporiaceae bacterium]|nr:hypothetical protein [Aeromicrobium sp.]